MLGELDDIQIDHILNSQYVGRIGCRSGKDVYVVPITYAYDGTYIYSFSKVGTKIKIMRKNPRVCFQVDAIDNMANWRSVLVWGEYEELASESERKKAAKIISGKLDPITTSETLVPKRQTMAPQIVEKQKRTISYRIRIRSKSGRYEKS